VGIVEGMSEAASEHHRGASLLPYGEVDAVEM
jgi:hypothetical protein